MAVIIIHKCHKHSLCYVSMVLQPLGDYQNNPLQRRHSLQTIKMVTYTSTLLMIKDIYMKMVKQVMHMDIVSHERFQFCVYCHEPISETILNSSHHIYDIQIQDHIQFFF